MRRAPGPHMFCDDAIEPAGRARPAWPVTLLGSVVHHPLPGRPGALRITTGVVDGLHGAGRGRLIVARVASGGRQWRAVPGGRPPRGGADEVSRVVDAGEDRGEFLRMAQRTSRVVDPSPRGSLKFSAINGILIAAGLAAITLGYVMLAGGSTVAAPLLLVLGYAVLVPLGIIL